MRDRSRDRIMRKLRGWDENYKDKNREKLARAERERRKRKSLMKIGGQHESSGTSQYT